MNDHIAKAFFDAVLVKYPNAQPTLNARDPFEILVAVMLSAQTTDRAVNAVTPKLFAAYPDPAHMAQATPAVLGTYIDRLGLWRNKARYLQALSEKLVLDFGGVVPQTYQALCSLPGVGRKTATVVRTDAFNIPGIAVDTHVSRIVKGFGIAPADATPDQIQARLQQLMPQDTWINLHRALIRVGREWLTAKKPELPPEWQQFAPYYRPLQKEEANG